MAAEPVSTAHTYGGWRRPASAGILGLGSLGTGLLIAGLVFVVIIDMFAGLLPAFVTALVLGGGLLLVLRRDKHGKNLLTRSAARSAWWWTRSSRANVYRSGPTGRTDWGTFQLPGLAASLRLSEHEDAYGRRFALLQAPSTRTYTVVLGSDPDGSALVDQEQINLWVARWGRWLASLADEPSMEAVSVTIETAPDTGHRLRQEVEANLDPQAPDLARHVLREVVETYPVGSSTVRAYIALTFNAQARSGSRRREPAEMGHELGVRLPALVDRLQETGAGAVVPLSAQELCEVVRVAYDPPSRVLFDQARAEGAAPDLSWSDVGPSATEASWAGYRHEGSFSRTWAMTGAPRGNVQASILSRLLAPHGSVDRKRVTLLYRPVDPARAAAIVESDLRAATFRASGRRQAQARDALDVRWAAAAADAEASGAGLVNFGVLVTATVSDPERMPDADATIDNMSAASRIRLRPVYGSQDSAFAAALPLGLVLRKHLQIPAELKEKL